MSLQFFTDESSGSCYPLQREADAEDVHRKAWYVETADSANHIYSVTEEMPWWVLNMQKDKGCYNIRFMRSPLTRVMVPCMMTAFSPIAQDGAFSILRSPSMDSGVRALGIGTSQPQF